MAIKDIYSGDSAEDVVIDGVGGEKTIAQMGIWGAGREWGAEDILQGAKENPEFWVENKLQTDIDNIASLPVVRGFDTIREDIKRLPEFKNPRLENIFKRLEDASNSEDFEIQKKSKLMMQRLNNIEDKYRKKLEKTASKVGITVGELSGLAKKSHKGWGEIDITDERDKIYKKMFAELDQWQDKDLLELSKDQNDRLLLETGNMVRDKDATPEDFTRLIKEWKNTRDRMLADLPKNIAIPKDADEKQTKVLKEKQKELRDKRNNIIEYTQQMSNFMYEMRKRKKDQPKSVGQGAEAWRALKRIYYSKFPRAVGGIAGGLSGGNLGEDYRVGGGAMALEPDLIESGKASQFMSSNWWTKNVVEGTESIAEGVVGAYLATLMFGPGGLLVAEGVEGAGAATGIAGLSGETVGFLGFALPMGLEVAGNKFSDTYEKLLKEGKSQKSAWATASVEGLLSAAVEVATERISWGNYGNKLNKALHGGWEKSLERGIKLSLKDKVRAYVASGASATFAEFMEENISSVGNDLIDALHGDSRIVKMVKSGKITWGDVERAGKEIAGNFAGVLSSFGLGAGGAALGIHNAEDVITQYDSIKSEIGEALQDSVDDVVGTVLTDGERTVTVVDVTDDALMVEDNDTGDMGQIVDAGDGSLVMDGSDTPWQVVTDIKPVVDGEVEPTPVQTQSEDNIPPATVETEPTPTADIKPVVDGETEPTPTADVKPVVDGETEPTPVQTQSEDNIPPATVETEPTPTTDVKPVVDGETEPTPVSDVKLQKNEFNLDTPDDKYNVGGHWQVFDVNDVLVSSDKGYPQELQPRNRASIQSKAQILSIAKNVKWQKLFESAGITSSGAPLVLRIKDGEFGNTSGEDKYVVVVGNGRWSGIRMGYQSGNGAENYKKEVLKHSASAGLEVNTEKPVLARVIDMDKLLKRDADGNHIPAGIEDMADFAVSSNKDEKLDMSNVEQAIVDAKIIIDNEMLSGFETDANGNVLARSNDPFLRRFVELVGASGVLVSRPNGGGHVWSKELGGRVERAMLAALFVGTDNVQQLLDQLIEASEFYGISRVVSAINKISGELLKLAEERPAYNIIPDTALALREFVLYKKDVIDGVFSNIYDFMAQGELFKEDGIRRTRVSEAILLRLGTATGIYDIVDFFVSYIGSARKLDLTPKDMFGVENDTKEQIIERIIQDEKQKQKEFKRLSRSAGNEQTKGVEPQTRDSDKEPRRNSKNKNANSEKGNKKSESEDDRGDDGKIITGKGKLNKGSLGYTAENSKVGRKGTVLVGDDVPGISLDPNGSGGILAKGETTVGVEGSGFPSGEGVSPSGGRISGASDNNQVPTEPSNPRGEVSVSRDVDKDGSSKGSQQGTSAVENTADEPPTATTSKTEGSLAGNEGGLSNTQVGNKDNRTSKTKDVTPKKEPAKIEKPADLEVKEKDLTFEEKLQAQKDAEEIPVKIGDRGNISETLPFLYKEQQDDVYKAEQRMLIEKPTPDDPKKGILFANGTGTGKTFTGLGIMKRYIKRGKGRIVVLVPTQAKVNDWIKEAKLLGITINKIVDGKDAGKGVVITTYANMRANPILQSVLFDLVVADESHYINSNAAGKENSSLRGFSRLVGKRLFFESKIINGFYNEIKKNIEGAGKNVEDYFEDEDPSFFSTIVDEFLGKKSLKKFEKIMKKRVMSDVVLLSATPFAYVKNIEYGDELLFHMGDKDRFMISNFGYRIRYGKLTKPEVDVDTGLLEREFSNNLQAGGVMSVRMLSVDKDYSRHFVDVDTSLGRKIQDGLDLIKFDEYPVLAMNLHRLHTYHYKIILLEALKTEGGIDRVEKHLALGRKVVVFHSRKKGRPFHPFIFEPLIPLLRGLANSGINDDDLKKLAGEIKKFNSEHPEYRKLDLSSLQNSIDKFPKRFGQRVVMFNGDVPAKQRSKNIKLFNDDNSGVDIIIVQVDAGKEGISLHDITGNGRQRVLMALNLPNKPVDISQMEGRIYRLGVKSNAIIEYLKTGLSMEKWAFGTSINSKSSTAENLALGAAGRDLKAIIKEQYINSESDSPSVEQGIGGKVRDRSVGITSKFQRAITYFFRREKKNKKTSGYAGADFFATPEPLGLKMVEWLRLEDGDSVLEPSAGDGAIARWIPDNMHTVLLEPSDELAGDLMVLVGGTVQPIKFEQLNRLNKFEGIVMNPPFGKQSKLAFEHVAKAFEHLENGGRIVALVPDGSSFDKRFNNWMANNDNAYLRASRGLPAGIFSRVGTSVKTKILIIDRVDDDVHVPFAVGGELVEFSGKPNMQEFFNAIEDMESIPRIEVFSTKKIFKKFSVRFSVKKQNGNIVVTLTGREFVKAVGRSFVDYVDNHYAGIDAAAIKSPDAKGRGNDQIQIIYTVNSNKKVPWGLGIDEVSPSQLKEKWAEFLEEYSGLYRGRKLRELAGEKEDTTPELPLYGMVEPKGELGDNSLLKPSKNILPKKSTKQKPKKLVGKSDIIKFINDNFMVVRKGRSWSFRKKKGGGSVKGFYNSHEDEIRLKNAESIEVVMHELGHALHGILIGKRRGEDGKLRLVGLNNLLSGVALGELESLGKSTSPIDKLGDKEYLQKEGLAEYVRRYIFAPETISIYAPAFSKSFEELLKTDPDVAKVVDTLRDMVQSYKDLSEYERVQTKIKSANLKKPKIKDFSRKLKKLIARIDEEMYDALSPLRRALDKVVSAKPNLSAEIENIWLEAWMLRGEAGRISAFLSHEVFDTGLRKVDAKPFAQILSEAVENKVLEEFEVYLVVQRGLELAKQDIKTGLEDISLSEISKQLLQKHPILKSLANDLKNYQNALLRYYAESGMMKKADAEKLISKNMSYVPFYRWFDSDLKEDNINESFLKVSGSYINLSPAIKRQFGSERSIISPLSGIVMNTVKMLSKADENRVGKLFTDLANDEETGWLVKKLDKQFNMKPITVTVGELLADLEGQGIGVVDLNELAKVNKKGSKATLEYDSSQFANDEVTIYRPIDIKPLPDEAIATVWRDGVPVVYQVDPGVASAMRGITVGKANWVIELMAIPTKMLRIGATTMPSFVVNNFAKDQTVGFINSQYGYNPLVDFVKGVYSFVKKDKHYIDFLKAGGANAMFVSQDIDRSKRDIEELVAFGAKGYHGMMKRGKWIASHPITAARKIGEAGEVGTRLGNFRKTFQVLQKRLAEKGKTGNPILDWVYNFIGIFPGIMNNSDDWQHSPSAIQHKLKQYDLMDQYIDLSAMIDNTPNMTADGAEEIKRVTAVHLIDMAMRVEWRSLLLQSGLAARDDTSDFGRWGKTTRVGSKMFAFMNPGFQEQSKMWRMLKNPKTRWGYIARAIVSITIPTLLETLMYRDDPEYQDLDKLSKDIFYHIKVGDRFIPIFPKAWGMNTIFGNIPRDIMNGILDAMDPDTEQHVIADLVSSIKHGFGMTLVPTLAYPIVENYANRSIFTGGTIVPPSTEGMEAKDQYKDTTSLTAKVIGNMVPGEGASPAKLENYVSSWTAGLGNYILMGSDKVLSQFVKDPSGSDYLPFKYDVPIIRRFLPNYSRSRSVTKMYDIYSEAKKQLASYKKAKKTNNLPRMKELTAEENWKLNIHYDSRRKKYIFNYANEMKQIASLRLDIRSLRNNKELTNPQKVKIAEEKLKNIRTISRKVVKDYNQKRITVLHKI
jgi:hypothetical protein